MIFVPNVPNALNEYDIIPLYSLRWLSSGGNNKL